MSAMVKQLWWPVFLSQVYGALFWQGVGSLQAVPSTCNTSPQLAIMEVMFHMFVVPPEDLPPLCQSKHPHKNAVSRVVCTV